MNTQTFFKSLVIGVGFISSFALAPSAYAGNNNCTQYRLSAYGGDAGFRVMSGSREFRQTHNGSVAGNICHTGKVQIELAKRDPHTRVSLALNGREYVFGQGDRGDRHVNNWFRRYINVSLNDYHKPHYKPKKSHSYRNNGYNGPRRSDKGYSEHRYQSSNSHYNDNHSSQHDYSSGYSNNVGHSHKYYGYKNLPRLKINSKRHRKAHRRDIPHQHRRNIDRRYVTYY